LTDQQVWNKSKMSTDIAATNIPTGTSMFAGASDIGIVLGKVVSFEADSPTVLFEYNGEHFCQPAFATLQPLRAESDLGADVCVGFSEGKLDRPIVIGKIHRSVTAAAGGVTVSSEREIILRCGKACIQLKSDGTVSIRGTNVASRASHTNRIRGGNIQIN